MSVLSRIRSRLRNDELAALRADIEAQRVLLYDLNHVVHETKRVIDELNHDVRSGSDTALPLYLGYVERLRVDAETAISATQIIERQLSRLDPTRPAPES